MPHINLETKYITETLVKALDEVAERIGQDEMVVIVSEPLKYNYWNLSNKDNQEVE
jgi:hypothetical protein